MLIKVGFGLVTLTFEVCPAENWGTVGPPLFATHRPLTAVWARDGGAVDASSNPPTNTAAPTRQIPGMLTIRSLMSRSSLCNLECFPLGAVALGRLMSQEVPRRGRRGAVPWHHLVAAAAFLEPGRDSSVDPPGGGVVPVDAQPKT